MNSPSDSTSPYRSQAKKDQEALAAEIKDQEEKVQAHNDAKRRAEQQAADVERAKKAIEENNEATLKVSKAHRC